MKKTAEEYKYTLPSIPDELKRATTDREKAYLDYIKALIVKIQQDFMTGFLHKEEFSRRQEVEKSTGAYIYLDGDGLKKINDQYGHAAGSAAILGIAEGIRKALRSGDEIDVSRDGGDEFLIFVHDASVSHCIMIAKRILENIRKQTIGAHYKGSDAKLKEILMNIPIKASLGVGKTKPEADQAMYKAKAAGRDRVEFHVEKDKVASDLNSRLIVISQKLRRAGKDRLAEKLVTSNNKEKSLNKTQSKIIDLWMKDMAISDIAMHCGLTIAQVCDHLQDTKEVWENL